MKPAGLTFGTNNLIDLARLERASRLLSWKLDCPADLRVPLDAGPGPHLWEGDQA